MSSVTLNGHRGGKFTSSEIVNLTKEGKSKGTWGAPALTYIEEKNMERRLGRSIDSDTDSRPTNWGKFMERMGAILLGNEYPFNSSHTLVHPTIDNWAGSPDVIKEDEGRTIVDFKAPFTLKSFCQLVQPLYDGLEGMAAMNAIRDTHKEGDKYYWQIVSNACITGAKWGELIVFCPYESEIPVIQHAVSMMEGTDQSKYYFIYTAQKEQLPYIKDGGYYANINIIRFEIPQVDKDKLTDLVVRAGELLISI